MADDLAQRIRRATVLQQAAEKIRELRVRNQHLEDRLAERRNHTREVEDRLEQARRKISQLESQLRVEKNLREGIENEAGIDRQTVRDMQGRLRQLQNELIMLRTQAAAAAVVADATGADGPVVPLAQPEPEDASVVRFRLLDLDLGETPDE